MKLILNDDVKNLGRIGEIVSVSDGYARNYLIPKKLAVEANTKNLKEFEHNKSVIMKKAEKIKSSFKATADKLSSISLIIKAKAGDENKLFGTVTTMDISNALKSEGFDIDKKKITIEEPIKRLGIYSVNVKFHPEVLTAVKVQVVQE